MKTLREVRLEYIKLVLEDSGWDFEKASRILEVPEDRLQREVRNLAKLSGGQWETRATAGQNKTRGRVKESFKEGKRPSQG